MRDLGNNLVSVQSLASAVTAGNDATVNGTAVDLKGFEGAYVNVNTGVEGVTLSNSLKIEFKLMHGDAANALVAVEQKDVTDGSVTSGVFLTLDDNAETPQTSSIGYIGGKRYVSVDVVFTGNHSTGTPMSIDVIKGYARHSEGASTVTVA